jgi:uncharacterized protein YjgD (DUF1641 family)
MNHEAELLQRMDHLEAQIAPLTESAKSLVELRDEMGPRLNEAVNALIVALADVEADFQLEDLIYLAKNVMRNVRNLNFTLDQLKNLIDFLVIAEPILKTTVPQIIDYLDDLEHKSVFRIMSIGLEALKNIGSTYSAEQLQQISEGLVRLVGIVHKLVAPEALDLLDKAAMVPASADVASAKPVGLFGLMGALSDPQMKAGVGVALELTKGLAALQES